nr:cathelicidin-B1-like [Zootoca vivipara]
MESSFWRVLLLVGAAAASTVLPPAKEPLSHEDAVALAVDLYNQKADEDFIYRLLKAAPQPNWGASSESTQELNFTIQETECLAEEEERPVEECSFRDGGPEPKRVKRSWLKKKFKKAKKSIKKGFRKIFKGKGITVGGSIPFGPTSTDTSWGRAREATHAPSAEGRYPTWAGGLEGQGMPWAIKKGELCRLIPRRYQSENTLKKMESCKLFLLLIGVVAAAPTARTPVSYEQVVAAAVDTYNQEQNPEFAFRLLEPEPQPDWDASGETTQPVKFSIKETVCPTSEKKEVSQCEYKEDGLDRDCSGFYSTQQSPPLIIVQCEDVDQELSRITRGRWRRFWRGAKRFVKRHGVSIALAGLRFG